MIVNYRVNYCQFEVNFCFWLISMQHAALVSQNKMDFFVNKNTDCALQKYIKIRDDCFKTMIVNYRVNYCQFEVNFCFWLISMQHAA